MVKVELDGVFVSRKKVRSKKTGKITVYEYHRAWRGGPLLDGKPGSPEYIASYQSAHENRRKPQAQETLGSLAVRFTGSPKFDGLAPSSRRKYMEYLKIIRAEFGAMPYYDIMRFESRRDFTEWHVSMRHKPRSADYALSVLQALLTWAVKQGHIEKHHADGIDRLSNGSRADIVWDETNTALIHHLPKHIELPTRFARRSGQRQADILALTWANVHENYIMLTTQKSGGKVRVFIWLTEDLRNILNEAKNEAEHVFLTTRGTPWGKGFAASQRKAFAKAGISEGLTFHDLRGTFENELWQSGCTEAEAYTVTGRVLKQHSANSYYKRSIELSKAAMTKYEGTFREQSCTKIARKSISKVK